MNPRSITNALPASCTRNVSFGTAVFVSESDSALHGNFDLNLGRAWCRLEGHLFFSAGPFVLGVDIYDLLITGYVLVVLMTSGIFQQFQNEFALGRRERAWSKVKVPGLIVLVYFYVERIEIGADKIIQSRLFDVRTVDCK